MYLVFCTLPFKSPAQNHMQQNSFDCYTSTVLQAKEKVPTAHLRQISQATQDGNTCPSSYTLPLQVTSAIALLS